VREGRHGDESRCPATVAPAGVPDRCAELIQQASCRQSDFMTGVLQVVPSLPPVVCGVGDHALLLARHLRKEHGIVTIFAAVDAEQARELEGFQVLPLERSGAALADLAAKTPRMLLHYVNYGYAARGCPIWLLQGLRRWLGGAADRRLVTMFHELFAHDGRPWESSFWTQPLQKAICRSTARISHGAVSNQQVSHEILGRMRGGRDVTHFPVFSNVGEPIQSAEFGQRARRLVIFGGQRWRSDALTRHLPSIIAACQRWNISEIVEIGPGATRTCEFGIPAVKLGPLPAAEVSAILSSSLLGFLSYASGELEKSGIFAAYAAHGLVPILPDDCIRDGPKELTTGVHYLSPRSAHEDHGDALLGQVTTAVFTWYQGHHSRHQGAAFAELLEG
jgi:hypothetical protein